MRNGKVAEWFLSLVMAPAQARTATGDLLEIGTTHSAPWFWSNVFQTWVATVWQQLKARPAFIVTLAVRGILIQAVIYASAYIAFGLLLIGIWHISHFSLPRQGLVSAMVLFCWFLFLIPSPFFAGRWIAKRSLGDDIPTCIAMTVTSPFIMSVTLNVLEMYNLLFARGPRLSPPHIQWFLHSWEVVFLIPYLVGAVLVRRNRQIARA